MAWLTGWGIRKLLYINGSSSGNQPSYQMKLKINYGNSSADSSGNIYCNSKCKSDFSDIRFTDNTGTNTLNYWIDQTNTVNGSYATIWIKIPNIYTGSNSTYIYLYYNNPSATSQSNGTNTFLLFDDFTGSSLDTTKWNQVNCAGCQSNSNNSWTVSGSYLTITSDIAGGAGIFAKNSFSGSQALETRGLYLLQKCYYGGYQFPIVAFDTQNNTHIYSTSQSGNGYCGQWESDNGATKLSKITSGSVSSLQSSSLTQTIGNLYNQSLMVDTNYITWLINGSNATAQATDSSYRTNLYAGILTYEYASIKVDAVFVRNYANPEPTWGSIGPILNINSTPTGAEVWLRTPSGTGPYIDQGIVTNTTIGITPGNYDVQLVIGTNYQYFLNQTFNSGSTYILQTTFPGQLSISSTPSGAEIWLGGVDRGVQTNNIISGLNPSPPDYTITLKLVNYHDWSGTATVNANQTTFVTATFAGSANITSTPSGASIYLDGSNTSIGTTPLIITNLTPTSSDGTQPTQTHTYILKLSGYADTSSSFIATAGTIVNIPVTFPGSIYITSLPTGAQIYIDGILQP